MDNLLSLIQSNPNGISSEELCQRANLPATQVLQALNHFLGRHAIVAIRDGSGKTLFRAQEDAELGNKLRGLKADERKIYDVIIESKDQGLATKDLQRKTNLPAAHVKTVCTRLAGRDLIKMVKPVHSKRMQVWMGAKVTPSKDVTGGLWYHNGELLETQIHDLYDKCCNVLRAKPDHAWSVDDVCNVLGLPDQATRMKGILKLLVLDRIAKEVKRLEGGLMGASEGSSFGRGESSFGGATASSGMFGGAEMGGSLLDNDDSMGGSLLGGFGGSAAFGGSSSSAFGGMGSDLGGPASRKRRAPGNTSELSLGGEEHSSELSTLYQAVAKEPKFSWTRLRDLPCTRCKVRSTCDANVMFSATPNPVSCRYLTEWLYNDKTIAAQEQVAGGVGGGGGRIGGAVGGGSAALPVKGTGGRAVGDIEDVL